MNILNVVFMALAVLLVSGCEQEIAHHEPDYSSDVLVSGQSNANVCEWSYFENATGRKVKLIAKGGYTIQKLIDDFYDNEPLTSQYREMIFVHGENDSTAETDPQVYVSKVYEYQAIIGAEKIYLSTVGYINPPLKDWSFDRIRNSVINEASYNHSWVIAYNGAKTFRDRDMLIDHVHFNKEACEEMMDSIIDHFL